MKNVRNSGYEFYFHVPRKLVEDLRRVRVVVRVDAISCINKTYHGSITVFRASLARIGDSSYRIKISKRFRSMAMSIRDCRPLNIQIAYILDQDREKD